MELDNNQTPDPTAYSRRRFLKQTGGATTLAAIGTSGTATAVDDNGQFEDDPFSLGVASGDPLPTSVILWTRLAPNPLQRGGGMPQKKIPVQWKISSTETMTSVEHVGVAFANPEHAHSVHVNVTDLEPGTEYYYQFETAGHQSPVGRTKTAPAPDGNPKEFTFAFASCQAWDDGFYTAYDYMATDELDLIIHLGDYIYEYGIGPNGGARNVSVPPVYRSETETLDRYRLQYGLYKSDRNLQAAHASAPWLVTRDDHEVDNNWAGDVPQDPDKQTREAFLKRRAIAFKAYFEHMPFRMAQMPDGSSQKLYRNYTFGDLAEFNVLDTRQYRTDQACDDAFSVVGCTERFSEDRTILGDAQEQWLVNNLETSSAIWDVIANQVPMASMDFEEGPKEGYRMDQWDGYVADRNTVLEAFEQHARNPVVVTGDFHANFASNIKRNFQEPDSASVGVEFVGTSISSGGDGVTMDDFGRQVLSENENVKYYSNQRGYVRCTLTPNQWRTDYRVVDCVTRKDAPIRTDASFVINDGTPHLQSR
ncbi:alkaline phosphatase D family protein [Halegenticoccus tardaugens]|uniref:alkaline phosphatase D family protein n=1 Tax=Halegenticoccus tardaugens TaxID=2071624 RepID=UPI00100C32A6|nr:alkaline phosphatase D family protein [Halegenticoccus tardaugens]